MTIPAMSPEYTALPPRHVRRAIFARITEAGARAQAQGVARADCPRTVREERAAWLVGHFLGEVRS